MGSQIPHAGNWHAHGLCKLLRVLAWSLSVLALFSLPATCGGPFTQGSCPSPDSPSPIAAGSGGVRLEAPSGALQARGRTLVVYVFAGTDPAYADNLRFFVDEAVQAGDGCEYVVVLQQGAGLAQPEPLPALPPNARYLPHPNECYDLGTVGWVLDQQANLASFAYVVLLNSSVRGPFLPAYLRGKMHWTEPLLSKLTDSVKLVGPTVNCGGVWDRNSPGAPHLQSYLLATDAVGLGVLRAGGSVMRCLDDKFDTVLTSEMGATAAVLAAGYNVDSLMVRYQGVDWRDVAARKLRCNDAYDPVYAGWNGGIDVDPFEVMFVKVKEGGAGGWLPTKTAVKLAEWLRLKPGTPEWWAALTAGP